MGNAGGQTQLDDTQRHILTQGEIADFETKENVQKVADDLAELDGTVKEMYINAAIDELIQGAKDYADTNVSVKVVKIIQSYTDIVNRTVWGK